MYSFIATLAKTFLWVLGRVEVKNKNLIPSDGGYLVTCTHKGWLDVIILGTSLPHSIHFMAKQELFNNKVVARFLSSINAFPVNREKPSPSSIKKPVKLLKSGEVVGVFPGGSRTAEDASLKRGAVTIANLARVPIVPAAYEGPRDLVGFLKKRKATIIFGEPFYVKTKSKEELVAFTERLSEETNRLYRQIRDEGDKNVSIAFRDATPQDLSLLRYWDSQPHVKDSDPNDDWEWVSELGKKPDWREQWIAELDGRPIGFVQILDPLRETSHYWGEVPENLRAIDIWIGERNDLGKGYGTQMMKLALDHCFQDDKVRAVLIDPLETNVKAHRFYERLGFKFVKKQIFGQDRCLVYRLDRENWKPS